MSKKEIDNEYLVCMKVRVKVKVRGEENLFLYICFSIIHRSSQFPPKTKKTTLYPPTKWKSVVEGGGMSKGDIKKDP
jgi:hypothetical protein